MVTNFLFAHQADILADEAKAATLRHNSYQLLMGINVNKHFPWLPDFLESLPLSISKPMMPPGLIDMLELFDVSLPRNSTIVYQSDYGDIESSCGTDCHHEGERIRSP